MAAARRRSTKKGMRRRTKSARRAYSPLPSSKKKISSLERSNKALRARLRRERGGNPMPTGPLKNEVIAYGAVAAGGAASGWAASWLEEQFAKAGIALPGGFKPEWLVTAAFIALPAFGYPKDSKIKASMALASSGMAAAQLSDYFRSR